MKRKLQLIISASAASLLTFTTLGRPDADNPKTTQQRTTTQTTTQERTTTRERSARGLREDRLGTTEKASALIGREVKNYQDEKLGKVDNLAIDLESGRIVQVVLSIGGFLGVGDHLIAVPPSALHDDAVNKVVHLDANKEKLKAAPKFETTDWDNSQSRQVTAVYQYYGVEPYFDSASVDVKAGTHESRITSSTGSKLGHFEKASKLIGTAVKNTQEERLGKVDNLIVDLAAGRVVAVILSSGGFLGIADELSAVPPTAFRFSAARDTLQLDVSKEALASAPHFKSRQWPDFGQPEYTVEIYRSYRVEPYFSAGVAERDPAARDIRERVNQPANPSKSTDADNTARNQRDRDLGTLTPLDQGKSPADRTTTADIRKQIMAAKGLSTNARNVKIITIEGRVTLRGPVASEEEKQMIEDIAARITPNATVDNQLEVKSNVPSQP